MFQNKKRKILFKNNTVYHIPLDVLKRIWSFLEDLELIKILPLVCPIWYEICQTFVQKCFLFQCHQCNEQQIRIHIQNKIAYFSQRLWYEKILYHFVVKENNLEMVQMLHNDHFRLVKDIVFGRVVFVRNDKVFEKEDTIFFSIKKYREHIMKEYIMKIQKEEEDNNNDNHLKMIQFLQEYLFIFPICTDLIIAKQKQLKKITEYIQDILDIYNNFSIII